jgi:DNA-binding XRE family transcriptional regulator
MIPTSSIWTGIENEKAEGPDRGSHTCRALGFKHACNMSNRSSALDPLQRKRGERQETHQVNDRRSSRQIQAENEEDMATKAKRAARARRKPRGRKLAPRTKPIAEPDTAGMVKQVRERFDLTQVELGKHIGVSTRTVIRWENGWPFPPWARLRMEEMMKVKVKRTK